jgi:hypothetical protein
MGKDSGKGLASTTGTDLETVTGLALVTDWVVVTVLVRG